MNQHMRNFSGGRIDRDQPLSFRFNNRNYIGFKGDTLASALLANGVYLVGRSFKYHRPRGILSAGCEEPNALVQLENGAYTQPNMRATQIELYADLQASSQNCWPSVEFDIGAINNLVSRVIPAGFYYKTFMWPASLWMHYEAMIRKAAGLGRAPEVPDPDVYDKMHAHCDVLVVGAGPAGLSAALNAARSGARVIIADEQFEAGGALLGSSESIDDLPGQQWAAMQWQALLSMSNVRCLPRSTVFAYFDHNYLAMVERLTDHLPPGTEPQQARQRLWKVRARQVVLATGAHERPLVFGNNDLPGVMLASAAQTYANRFAVKAGKRAVVFSNNDSAWDVAFDLSQAGLSVQIVDVRASIASDLLAKAQSHAVGVFAGDAVIEALSKGQHLSRVRLALLDDSAQKLTRTRRTLDCDLLCMSGGWSPAVHLHSQSGARVIFDEQSCCFVPDVALQASVCVGAANGAFSTAQALAEGWAAGAAAVEPLHSAARSAPKVSVSAVRETQPMRALWQVPSDLPSNKSFVDFQNDVTAADIRLAAREGYQSVEHWLAAISAH